MLLGVGQRERLRAFRDQADEAFAPLHRREMDRLAVQALCGEKLKPSVGAQDIDRTDLGHHIGRDMRDDFIQPRLRADRLRHDFAEPAQQKTGTAQPATHGEILTEAAPHMASGSPRDVPANRGGPADSPVTCVNTV